MWELYVIMVKSNSYSKSVNKHCPLYLYLKCLTINISYQIYGTSWLHIINDPLLVSFEFIMIYLN